MENLGEVGQKQLVSIEDHTASTEITFVPTLELANACTFGMGKTSETATQRAQMNLPLPA
jgi:hypothetical protein